MSNKDFYELISKKTDNLMMPYWRSWFNNLTTDKFETNNEGEILNLFSNSEKQSIGLYTTCWGHYWNKPLHNSEPVVDYKIETDLIANTIPKNKYNDPNNVWINGEGYKYIEYALKKSKSQVSMVVYHGVEFMENEFYNQLKSFISLNDDGTNNYDNIVGKKIKTNGFISTTTNKEWAKSFSEGKNWTDGDKLQPPFGEPVMFEISFYKNQYNIAYISGFEWINQNGIKLINTEASFLLNIGTEFEITSIKKENGINVFKMKVL